MASTTEADFYWIFEGKRSQAISLSLETAFEGFDPYLTLQRADGTTLVEDDDAAGDATLASRPSSFPSTVAILLKSGARTPLRTAPYTLTSRC